MAGIAPFVPRRIPVKIRQRPSAFCIQRCAWPMGCAMVGGMESNIPENASEITAEPGAYALVFRIDSNLEIPTGRLGTLSYTRGWYAYVGSAMGGLSRRLSRYRKPIERLRWHIDRLLPQGEDLSIVAAESADRVECDIARYLAERFDAVPRFGSSDCRCGSHLYFSTKGRGLLMAAIGRAFREVGAGPIELSGQ